MADKAPVIQDLDILRPPSEYVRLAGRDIDISFIPSGIAMDIMRLQDELNEMTATPDKMKALREGGNPAQRAFEIAAELCAAITKNQHPELDKDWLLRNTDIVQLRALMDHVVRAVHRSLQSVEDEDSKKQKAAHKNP